MSEFMEELAIDEYALEMECADQPRKFMKWAEKYANAVFDLAEKKRKVRVVTAETELKVRTSEPDDYGLTKWTEGAVKSIIDKHPDVLAAEDAYFEAIRNAELMKGAKEAFQDRKQELSNLTSLRNAQYFADPLREAETRAVRVQQNQAALLENELPK